MPESSNNQSHHSVPVQEIMGVMPSWITRWGITILFSILLCILLGCFLIKYPEVVSASVTIQSFSISDAAEEHPVKMYETLVLDTDISPNSWEAIKVGQDIILRIDPGKSLKGKIVGIQTKNKIAEPYPILSIEVKNDSPLGNGLSSFVCGMLGSIEIIVSERRIIDYLFQRQIPSE